MRLHYNQSYLFCFGMLPTNGLFLAYQAIATHSWPLLACCWWHTTLLGSTKNTSIKLKIDERVGASLLELESDWCSWIPYEDALVIVSTDQYSFKRYDDCLSNWSVSTIFMSAYFSKVDSVKCEVLWPLSKKTFSNKLDQFVVSCPFVAFLDLQIKYR